MYAWATPEKLLDEMSLDQVIMYFREGWKARKIKAQLFWGVLGELLDGGEDKKTNGISGLDKFKDAHPEGKNADGSWRVSR